ncbi:UvrD-helicase domain-containing protein [Kosakonia sacchari]|uniref:DNA 3'-5' helicase n=1 Tax=Kosakonia sacchari TaxID=1158459 RepID=A0ABZ0MWJ0_9ENTR|nr:ATP-dependent helicase [Kosakonia sacchari]WOZ79913.1 ATP-dependent helicase [Kosakonia sacchari]
MATFTPSEEQKQAINYNSDMVIIARPGSGKTSVLSCKVRNMVSELRPYQGIIAISFTNKASDELERRCKVDAFDTKASFFGTIDDFCLREIIYPFARQFLSLAEEVKTAKIRELPGSLTTMLPVTPLEEGSITNTISFLPFIKESLAQGFVPLEAVGMLAYYVVEKSIACKKYLKARYKAICVDEYQDSGYFQHQLFQTLKELGLTAIAVGDSDQSIYAFAKKDPKYLLALTLPGSGFEHFSITTNFRCHPSINDFALRLLNSNHPIPPTNDMRVFIKTINGDQRAMSQWLESAIPHLMEHYQVPSAARVAILCRHQHSARLIANNLSLSHQLLEDNPFEIAPTIEANLFSDLLKLRYDPKMTAESLIERACKFNLSSNERRKLRRTVLSCRTCLDSDLLVKVFTAASDLVGQKLAPAAVTELEGICADASKLRWFQRPSDNAVQIMTLHKAKGLEFELVFHADLYDHVLPSRIYPPGTYGQVIFENEIQCLNLHYVGVTRAVKACVLMTSNYRINGQNNVKNGEPSQFIGRNGAIALPINW